MKSPARLGWLVAILLALSLIAPFSSPASAAQTEASTPTTDSSQTVTATPTPEPSQTADSGDGGVGAEATETQPAEVVDEPVVAAALGDLKIYSKNDANEDVSGGTYAIYDSTCTTLLAGPTAADEFGTVTFLGVAEQGTQVCIIVTVTPPGYLDPIGVVVTMSTEAALTQWSFVFTAAPVQTYDLPIFKVDSETDALLGGAGFTIYYGACPGGDFATLEQFTGPSDAVDGSAGRTIFQDLPAGDYCVVETTAPAGYSGQGNSATVNLPENASGWTFTDDPLPPDTYDLPIYKEDSETGAKLGGVGFTVYYGDCGSDGAAVGPEQFTGDASAVDGSAGRTIFSGLAAGNYCVAETTAPSGYTVSDPVTLNLPENASGWTFQDDPIAAETYSLPVFKESSETGAKLGGAGFTLFYDACTGDGGPVGPEQFTGDADAIDGSAGRTIFENLAAGDYCLVETTAPDGYYRAGPVTVSLPDNVDGWTVLDDPIENTGTLRIEKSFCPVDDPDDAGTFFGAIFGGAPDDCVFGAASFYIWPANDPGDVTGPVTTDSQTGVYSLDLPAGEYVLLEISSGAQYEFELGANETTLIPVWNMIYDEGSLYVTKIYCKAKYDMTDITFDYPVDVSAAGWDWGHKPKCWQGDANFEVWLYGDPENVITFNTGADGEVWLILPETSEATGPHKLVETDTGAWAWFDVSRGEITYATVTNYFKAYHPQPVVTPTATGTGSVTTLPATGTGENSGSNAWYLLGVALVGMAGLAGIALRRKPGAH